MVYAGAFKEVPNVDHLFDIDIFAMGMEGEGLAISGEFHFPVGFFNKLSEVIEDGDHASPFQVVSNRVAKNGFKSGFVGPGKSGWHEGFFGAPAPDPLTGVRWEMFEQVDSNWRYQKPISPVLHWP
jgi:hypothetical protein